MEYVYTEHLVERALERGISSSAIKSVLDNPDQVIDDESGEEGQKVYQSIEQLSGKSAYLVRIFVDTNKQPHSIKTAYKTSKISKYYESQIQ